MPPRLHHFIVRPELVKQTPTGLVLEQPLVPLVPLDELPDWLDIVGVPRHLAPEQTPGLSNLGCYERQGSFEAEIIIDDQEDGSDVSADNVSQQTAPPAVDGTQSVNAAATAQPELEKSRWANSVDDSTQTAGKDVATTSSSTGNTQGGMQPANTTPRASQPAPATTTASQAHQTPNTQSPGTTSARVTTTAPSQPSPNHLPKRRIHCRHWCHHGTCKWGPYCRFQHTMPATPTGLSEVGLRDFPAWWSAAMALSSSSPPPPVGYDARFGLPTGGGFLGVGERRGVRYGFGHGRVPGGDGGVFPGGPPGYGGYGGYTTSGVARRGERELHPYETVKGRGKGAEGGTAGLAVAVGKMVVQERGGSAVVEQQQQQQQQQPVRQEGQLICAEVHPQMSLEVQQQVPQQQKLVDV